MKYSIIIRIILICMVSIGTQNQLLAQSDSISVMRHLRTIVETGEFRHYKNTPTLDSVASYIFKEFALYADTVFYQEFFVFGNTYRNVIARFGTENEESIIVGAHYDVCGPQDGADDNASGVVGLLELSRLLYKKPLTRQIELVAYSLEEPPFFRTENMGSYIHAESLIKDQRNIYGMLCLEMIGYFNDQKGSQAYPLGIFSLFYGNRGDYITLVNKFGKGNFARKFSNHYKKNKQIPTKKFSGPKSLTGIDFSDHLNYWHFGFSAVMLCNTGFFRNQNYHQTTDKIETLDIGRMCVVINVMYKSLLSVSSEGV